jgi:hypothetical protein
MPDLLLDTGGQRPRYVDVVGAILVAVFFGAVPLVVIIKRLKMEPLEWVLFGLWASVSLVALLVALVHLLGHERLILEDGRLRGVRDVGPVHHEWSVRLSDISDVRVPALGREFMIGAWGVGVPALVLKTRAGTYRCCMAIHPRTAEILAERIRSAAGRVSYEQPGIPLTDRPGT